MGLGAPRQDRMRRLLFASPLLVAVAALAFLWSVALQDRNTDVVQVCVGLSACGSGTDDSVAATSDQSAPLDKAEDDGTPPDTTSVEPVDSVVGGETGSSDEDPESSKPPLAESTGSGEEAGLEPSATRVVDPTTTPSTAASGTTPEPSQVASAASTSTPNPSVTATPRTERPAGPATTSTPTANPSATATPQTQPAVDLTPTATPTATPTSRAVPTATRVPAVAAAPTATSLPSPTATAVPAATSVPTPTTVPTATPTPTPTPTPTATAIPAPSGPQPVGQPGNWNLIFEDNFDFVDRSKWETAWFSSTDFTPPVNDNGGACFHPNQVTAIGGQIEMRLDPTTDARCRLKNGEQADYVGSLINTRQTFTFSYGYAEARMFLPGADGSLHNWPAFWHTGFDWPATGEVDIVEGLSGGQPCSVYHYEQGGVHQQNKSCVNWPDPTGWHVFAADWQPGSVTFYYDGVEVFRTTQGVVGAPHYLILDYTLRANGDGTSAPSAMLVDYVRVWTSD